MGRAYVGPTLASAPSMCSGQAARASSLRSALGRRRPYRHPVSALRQLRVRRGQSVQILDTHPLKTALFEGSNDHSFEHGRRKLTVGGASLQSTLCGRESEREPPPTIMEMAPPRAVAAGCSPARQYAMNAAQASKRARRVTSDLGGGDIRIRVAAIREIRQQNKAVSHRNNLRTAAVSHDRPDYRRVPMHAPCTPSAPTSRSIQA